MSRLTAAAIVIFLALPVLAQERFRESIEVRVVTVDVAVRDRAGDPVTGLTGDDFELYDNGTRQPITNLYEVRRSSDLAAAQTTAGTVTTPEAPPAPVLPVELKRRRFILFVDSGSLEQAHNKMVLAAAERFLDRWMEPEDEATLLSWRLGLRVVTPFTSDKNEIRRGLAALGRIAPGGEAYRSSIDRVKDGIQFLIAQADGTKLSWPAAYKMATDTVTSYANSLLMEEQKLLEALNRVISNADGLEGKKVLVLVGEHIPERPGAELYRYVYEQFGPRVRRGSANEITPDLQAVTGVIGNTVAGDIEKLARRAAAGNVTMYTINTSSSDMEMSAENAEASDSDEGFFRKANTAAALNTMATLTGGIALSNTSNFDLAFDTIRRDLESYYSLAYKPSTAGSDAPHRIEVKAKNAAYSVRTRHSLAIKSTDELMTARAIANLYTDPAPSGWPISIKTGPPKPDGAKFIVPVRVVMAPELALIPEQENLVGGFVLYFVVGKSDGRNSEVMRRPQGLKIPPSAEKLVRAKPMTFDTQLRIDAGESTLSVAIIDQITGTTGFARTKIVAH